MGSPLLEVDRIGVSFPTRQGSVRAVEDVSFAIAPGESLGIVGESGSGKSVTALAILGLIPSPGQMTRGSITFDGKLLVPSQKREWRALRGRDIGMVFQDPGASLNPVLTVGDQISEPLILHKGLSHRQARTRSIELLELVGIPAPAQRVKAYPHQFSGGMRQRVMIAMAVACQPRLLIADEPTTALDVTVQAQIVTLLMDLRDRFSMSLVLITHDMGLVAGLVDRLCIMYAGRLVEAGNVFEVFDGPAHPYTKGLLASIPPENPGSGLELHAISGSPPNPMALPSGCPFHPRCPVSLSICSQTFPPATQLSGSHQAVCWQLTSDEDRKAAMMPTASVLG